MPADPEVALLRNSDRLEEIKTLEIAAVVDSRSIPLVRLIIGSTGAEKPARRQQRHNGARLLEHLLAISYPGRAGAWRLSHRSSGAPFLEGGDDSDPGLEVSASHAGQWAAAALSTAAAVGVDIEQERPGREPQIWHGFYLQVAEDVHAALVLRTRKPAVTTVHVLDGKQARPW